QNSGSPLTRAAQNVDRGRSIEPRIACLYTSPMAPAPSGARISYSRFDIRQQEALLGTLRHAPIQLVEEVHHQETRLRASATVARAIFYSSDKAPARRSNGHPRDGSNGAGIYDCNISIDRRTLTSFMTSERSTYTLSACACLTDISRCCLRVEPSRALTTGFSMSWSSRH